MKLQIHIVGSLALAACMAATSLNAQSANSAQTARPATKKKTAAPSVQEQIQELRKELARQADLINSQSTEINGLKKDLTEKDARMQAAEQEAATAQAAADKANTTAGAVADNTAAIVTLKTSLENVKTYSTSLAATLNAENNKIKKEIAFPAALHYKGITLTPGGFIDADTVYRSKAIGSDIPTSFNSIPYEGDDRYQLSEFYGSARPTRITMLAEGKPKWGALRGYLEADFQGVGTSSNNNQTNSYVLRQRVLYGEAETNHGWKLAFGQMWSLATEGDKGIPSNPANIKVPLTIDTNYMPGFIWARQYGVRIVKRLDKGKFTLGFAVENPQLLYTANIAGETPLTVLGSAGNASGYNASISSANATTYVKNYLQAANNSNAYGYYPVYGTLTTTTNIANYSFNAAPDLLVKAVADPGWGHYEIFGLVGFAHQTIYPNVNTDSIKYGGQWDVQCPSTYQSEGCTEVAQLPDATKAVANRIVLGGVGASARIPVIKNLITFGAKALYGPGVGRYGDSNLADVTSDQNGALAPIHNLSGLLTLEVTPTKRLTLWANYGGDYAARADFGTGYYMKDPHPCYEGPGNYFLYNGGDTSMCVNPLTASTATSYNTGGAFGGSWYVASAGGGISSDSTKPTWVSYYPIGVGYGPRFADSSAAATTSANATGCGINGIPTYSDSDGYHPAASADCSLHTRNVQEVTGGYYYDIYKGDYGRLRQGVQYGYAVRESWSGALHSGSNLTGIKGIDNMFWTSLRYYLP